MRKFQESELLLASHNQGKLTEIKALLQDFPFQVISAADIDLPEPEETEDSFIGNALLKARAAHKATGKAALADDSGFAVRALAGAPGIYSARWAGPDKDFGMAMQKVQDQLQASGSDDRHAAFHCAFALVWPDGHEEAVEGIVEGTFTWPARGQNGFGYDPVFVPVGDNRTYAEMDPAEKLADNHRARAFKLLIDHYFQS